MTILQETYQFLAAALTNDPLLCLANCVVWLDPLWTWSEDEYTYTVGNELAIALAIARDVFPDLYAGAVGRLHAGASHLDVERYLCNQITELGIPLDDIEYMAWGIPLTACGAELTNPEFFGAHPDLLPVLEVFGVVPEPDTFYVEFPRTVYLIGEVIADSLAQHPDPHWQQIGWAMQWLFSCSGNTLIDATDELLAESEPLSWVAEDIAFAIEMIQEANTIVPDVNAGLTLIEENPTVLQALGQNVKCIQRAIKRQKGKDGEPKVKLKWPALSQTINERKSA